MIIRVNYPLRDLLQSFQTKYSKIGQVVVELTPSLLILYKYVKHISHLIKDIEILTHDRVIPNLSLI